MLLDHPGKSQERPGFRQESDETDSKMQKNQSIRAKQSRVTFKILYWLSIFASVIVFSD